MGHVLKARKAQPLAIKLCIQWRRRPLRACVVGAACGWWRPGTGAVCERRWPGRRSHVRARLGGWGVCKDGGRRRQEKPHAGSGRWESRVRAADGAGGRSRMRAMMMRWWKAADFERRFRQSVRRLRAAGLGRSLHGACGGFEWSGASAASMARARWPPAVGMFLGTGGQSSTPAQPPLFFFWCVHAGGAAGERRRGHPEASGATGTAAEGRHESFVRWDWRCRRWWRRGSRATLLADDIGL